MTRRALKEGERLSLQQYLETMGMLCTMLPELRPVFSPHLEALRAALEKGVTGEEEFADLWMAARGAMDEHGEAAVHAALQKQGGWKPGADLA